MGLARRIVVAPDPAVGRRLGALGETLGTTLDLRAALDDDPAELCVVHARDAAELVPELTGETRAIAIAPRASLAEVVELMQSSERIAGMVVEDGDDRGLVTLATRVLAADGFGLEAVMGSTEIHTVTVGDHREKTACLAQVAAFGEQAGVPRRVHAPIEQCLDEMLMNALYDAPVDARGEHVFAGVPTTTRITMRTDQRVVVQYACDGKRFAIAVRDAFGSLERATVLRYLHKCLHSAQQIDRKAGGAGVGLYLMVTAASAVHFTVVPGIATEAVCVFELAAPTVQLEQFGFVVQRDAGGRIASKPARRRSAVPHRRRIVLGALAAVGVLVGVLVVPRLVGSKPVEPPPPPPVATVELESDPTGAAVDIAGTPMGSTPLVLTELVPGASVSVTFARAGYRSATVVFEVPAVGATKRVVQPLALSEDFVRVRFVSTPPGAEVVRRGHETTIDRTYTPADVFVEVDTVQHFSLTMPGHTPLVIEPFTPKRGEQGLEKGGALVELPRP